MTNLETLPRQEHENFEDSTQGNAIDTTLGYEPDNRTTEEREVFIAAQQERRANSTKPFAKVFMALRDALGYQGKDTAWHKPDGIDGAYELIELGRAAGARGMRKEFEASAYEASATTPSEDLFLDYMTSVADYHVAIKAVDVREVAAHESQIIDLVEKIKADEYESAKATNEVSDNIDVLNKFMQVEVRGDRTQSGDEAGNYVAAMKYNEYHQGDSAEETNFIDAQKRIKNLAQQNYAIVKACRILAKIYPSKAEVKKSSEKESMSARKRIAQTAFDTMTIEFPGMNSDPYADTREDWLRSVAIAEAELTVADEAPDLPVEDGDEYDAYRAMWPDAVPVEPNIERPPSKAATNELSSTTQPEEIPLPLVTTTPRSGYDASIERIWKKPLEDAQELADALNDVGLLDSSKGTDVTLPSSR
ncbi:hypothetical protein I8H84_04260 [Candidatus Saccharibacteria bacterium]|nr:hypothetical protein [Candidatus Saccharibacteria bacterium]MBH1973150.1 hypothetical protein [Candidatus Saccharibacteria bacterium]MBH1990608.1 hypothetical protein [Candidatus Saccharibacteria bacterium]